MTNLELDILRCEIAYRNGEALVSDEEFDNMLNDLRRDNPKSRILNRQFSSVSSDAKVKLPVEMRSLDKVKTIDEIKKWADKFKINGSDSLVITPKYDGLSILYNRRTREAWTRGGDDNMGYERGSHLAMAGNLLDCESAYEDWFIGGEILISKESWKNNFESKINPDTGKPYKSPRGTVAGFMNSPKTSSDLFNCDFVPYLDFSEGASQKEYACTLDGLKDYIINHKTMYALGSLDKITEENLTQLYDRWSEFYEIDGLVISVNDPKKRAEMGRDENTRNPNHSVAFKGKFETVYETTVKNVNVCVSKNGYLRPTVEIEPVIVSGCEISNPTGNNMAFIVDNEIAKGTVLKVIRSGAVIPKIIHSYKNNKAGIEELLDTLTECPSCQSPTDWNNTMTDLVCSNEKCIGRQTAKMAHMLSVLGFEEIPEKIIEAVTKLGFDVLASDLVAIDGIGEKSAALFDKQRHQAQTSKHKLNVLMHASDCFTGIGEKKAELVCQYIAEKGIELHEVSQDELETIKGIGKTNAVNIISGMDSFYHWLGYFGFSYELPAKVEEIKDGDLLGESICFSGVRDKELEKQLRVRGAKIVSSVSKNTTMLVVKDSSASSSKISKANEMGIKVVEIDSFK
ncbi:MAG: BRCT domain-containing protein [Bacteroidales bacterium]